MAEINVSVSWLSEMGMSLLAIAVQIEKHLPVPSNAGFTVGNVYGDEHKDMLQKAQGITT